MTGQPVTPREPVRCPTCGRCPWNAVVSVRAALQGIHELRTHDMHSVDALRHEKRLNAIAAQLQDAARLLERLT